MDDFPKYGKPFEPGEFYHFYNSAVSKEKLFTSSDNYIFFLDRFHYYTKDILSVYSFCLLDNHFHFLVKIHNVSNNIIVAEQLRKFFISYSKSYNKFHHRRGTLFNKHLKRVKINDEQQLCWTIYYIHRNPVHHGLTQYFKKYRWSSYRVIVSDKPTKLARNEVLDIFYGLNEFTEFHERNIRSDILNNKIHLLETK